MAIENFNRKEVSSFKEKDSLLLEIINTSKFYQKFEKIKSEAIYKSRSRSQLREFERRVEEQSFLIYDLDIDLPDPTTVQQREMTAHEMRVDRLREPHMQALLSMLRTTPHIWEQIHEFTGRKADLVKGTKGKDELHRTLSPLIAGICNVPEARAYFELFLDEASTAESNELKKTAGKTCLCLFW